MAMSRKNLRIITLTIAMICLIFMFAPINAEALPIDVFEDGSLLLDVSFLPTKGDFEYSYDIRSTGEIDSISVGTVNPYDSSVSYGVVSYNISKMPSPLAVPGYYPLTSNSLFLQYPSLQYLTALPPGDYEFSIIFDNFVDSQYISFTGGGNKAVLVDYDRAPVPEPSTILLLGGAITCAGLLRRRRRKI